MKIGLIQNDPSKLLQDNLSEIKNSANACIKQGADILMLGEMWNTPYTNEAIRESTKDFETCHAFLQDLSKDLSCMIVGGTLAHPVADRTMNECTIFDHGRIVTSYAKTHLFEIHAGRSYCEKDVFTPGDSLCTFDTPWGKAGLCICYDIRFPEVCRILAQNGARIIFCPAAFNKSVTLKHWTPLFQVRAMENQVFMIGVNPRRYRYQSFESFGHSIVTGPFAEIVDRMDEQEPYHVCTIDPDQVDRIRKRMPFWQIRRTDIYRLEEKK